MIRSVARKLAAVVVLALVVTVAILEILPYMKRIERRSAVPGFADSSVAPASVDRAAAAIVALFNDGHRLGFSALNKYPAGDKWHYFFLWGRADGIFPDDLQVAMHTSYDPALQRYCALASGAKKRDFYLYEPSGDFYWRSEYFCDGAPAKFRCAFIIHLEPFGPGRTQVQVIEYLPIIWVGSAWCMLGHSGPGFYYDIRFDLEPTAIDRAELLELIQKAVSAAAANPQRASGAPR
jgi:hypothetical protein